MFAGTLTRNVETAAAEYTGMIHSTRFDVAIQLEARAKMSERSPDYDVTALNKSGRKVRIGTAWNETGNTSGKMPIGPRGSEADVERARERVDGQPSGQSDVVPKKTAPVVQAVITEEQRQMEMDFFDENSMDGPRENADVQVFETALKNLGMLEARISEN